MDERAALMVERVMLAFEEDPEGAVGELQNAADEIRYGWLGSTVTPYVSLGDVYQD
jgi:hypothetical protein